MIENFLKIAFRNLVKNKAFSLINISGLAVGMASAILILLWIRNELSYDQFHEKKDRIYEGWNKAVFSGKLQCWNTTPKVMARTLQTDFPEVERTVRVNWPSSYLFSVGDKGSPAQGILLTPAFCKCSVFPCSKEIPKRR